MKNKDFWQILNLYTKIYLDSKRDTNAFASIVRNCYDSDVLIKAASITSNDGFLLETYPELYSKLKGSNLNSQPHTKYYTKYQSKFISRLFRAVQGFDVIVYINPIVENNIFLGSVNILIDPEKLIGTILAKSPFPQGSQVILIQGDGTILYSTLPKYEHNNILTYSYQNDVLGNKLVNTIGSQVKGKSIFSNTKENKSQTMYWQQIPMEKDKWIIVAIVNN